MCSPEVAKAVQERIEREGRPALSRRNFLKLGGAAAAGLAIAQVGLPVRRASAQASAAAIPRVLDLSYTFATNVPTYTPGEEPTRSDFVTVEENGFYIQKWELYEHSGTHMDFPAHFIAGGATVDNYDPALLVGPAVVIDIRAKAEADPDAMLEVADLEAWEAANGEIPAGAIVFMNSGWGSRWPDADAFRNPDADGVMHFPGFSGAAAMWLLENRDIRGIGVDTLSLDPDNSTTFDVHYAILGADKYGIENVANTDELAGVPNALVVVGVNKWEEGSGGPGRLLALISG
jgi:kynurenine formamidase